MCDNFDSEKIEYTAHSGYVVREIAGEFLLIPVEMRSDAADQLAIMNETGKFLWSLLRNGSSEEKLLQEMLREYQVSEEEAKADIKEFINSLKAFQLVQENGGE